MFNKNEVNNTKTNKISNVINSLFKNIAEFILLFIVITLLYVTVIQFLKISINSFTFYITLLISCIAFYILKFKIENNYKIILSIVLSIVLVLVSIFFIGKTYDVTCDGNTYHKYAVGNLKNGWNPLYQSSYDFSKENELFPNKNLSLWVDHYAKATWNFGAVIYAFTNDIESGKVICLLLAFTVFFLLTEYLYTKKIKFYQAIIISTLLAFNPIVCSQIFSYYVDATLGLSLFLIILFLIMITDKNYTGLTEIERYILLFCSIVLCINIKFTGLLFAGVFSIIFYIYWLIVAKKENKLTDQFIKKSIFFAITLAIAIFFVGYSTYVTNTINNKNPLYPLFGKEKVDIITTMQPVSFKNIGGLQKLFYSIFSKTENVTYVSGKSTELKIPYLVKKSEISSMSIPDTRIGGYGPLFSGTFITSILVIITYGVTLIKNKCKDKYKGKYKIISENMIMINLLLGIIVCTLLMAESWWARYSPYIYLIPILAVIILFIFINENNIKGFKNKLVKLILIFMIILPLLLDNLIILRYRLKDIYESKNISTSLYLLKMQKSPVTIKMNDSSSVGILFDLKDKNINFVINNNYDGTKNAYNYQIIY